MADQVVILELFSEMSLHIRAGTPAPASLVARFARALRAMGGPEAAHQRELLQAHSRRGNELAIEVMELLADDPWWSETS